MLNSTKMFAMQSLRAQISVEQRSSCVCAVAGAFHRHDQGLLTSDNGFAFSHMTLDHIALGLSGSHSKFCPPSSADLFLYKLALPMNFYNGIANRLELCDRHDPVAVIHVAIAAFQNQTFVQSQKLALKFFS